MKNRAHSLVVALLLMATVGIAAPFHQITFKGTVVSATATSLKVTVVDEKTKKPGVMSFDMDEETKILRGDKRVTFAAASIQKNEKIAVTIDHDVDETLAIIVRLDAKK